MQLRAKNANVTLTCETGGDHVHLRGVGLQYAIQLLFGRRVGCEIDRSVGEVFQVNQSTLYLEVGVKGQWQPAK